MVLTEAANVRSSIHSHLLSTDNLVAIAFVSKNWKKIQTSFSEDLEKRTLKDCKELSFAAACTDPK